jgi:peptidyl-prolyl cis-trans isomerase B (cyclophilin B)
LVTKQQRARQLAREKWERQQARRNAQAVRIRRLVIGGWAVFGLAVAGLVVWFGATQLGNESPAPTQGPVLPGLSPSPLLQPPNYSPPASPSGTPT